MNEIDLIQAFNSAINMGYLAGQWWMAVSTALVLATYFAARHIPPWFFAMIIVLYLLTAMSAVFEVIDYSTMAENYGARLQEFRATHHIPFANRNLAALGYINSAVNYAVFLLGTVSASVYSWITWREARAGARK